MSRNTKKSSKTNKKSKVSKTKKNRKSSDYISVGDALYERISGLTEEVEIDLAEDVLDKIDDSIRRGVFVSRGDAIRHILRTVIDSKQGLE